MADAVPLTRGAPEAQGMRSAAIHAFVDAVERDAHDLHSLMILRHGHIVAEGWWAPYGPSSPHMLFSLSKSFTSTAIGMLVAEGRLSVEDPVLSFFPDQAPAEPSANLRAMRVRDLLTMTTGHAEEPMASILGQVAVEWTRAFLAQPVQYQPGTHFVYNTPATYMLSAIAQRITGMRLTEYLTPRLFTPLGIANPVWDVSPQGIDLGGTGLNVTTEAIARFGQLYLQKGMWQGARLLPESWIEQATTRQVDNGSAPDSDWEQGYGYQFWRCRHGAYRGDGAFGQFCVALPAQEAVVAITSGLSAMQPVLDLVWQHLLPAMGPEPLAEDTAAQEALTARLADLRLRPQQGAATSPTGARVAGQTFVVTENEDRIGAIRFDIGDQGAVLTLHNAYGEQRIPCGAATWARGRAAIEHPTPWPVAASGAWTDDQTYVAQLWWYETPFKRTLTCRFEGDRLRVEQQVNVAFGPTERPLLNGRLA